MTKPRAKTAAEEKAELLVKLGGVLELWLERGGYCSDEPTHNGGRKILITIPPKTEPLGPMKVRKGKELDIGRDD